MSRFGAIRGSDDAISWGRRFEILRDLGHLSAFSYGGCACHESSRGDPWRQVSYQPVCAIYSFYGVLFWPSWFFYTPSIGRWFRSATADQRGERSHYALERLCLQDDP